MFPLKFHLMIFGASKEWRYRDPPCLEVRISLSKNNCSFLLMQLFSKCCYELFLLILGYLSKVLEILYVIGHTYLPKSNIHSKFRKLCQHEWTGGLLQIISFASISSAVTVIIRIFISKKRLWMTWTLLPTAASCSRCPGSWLSYHRIFASVHSISWLALNPSRPPRSLPWVARLLWYLVLDLNSLRSPFPALSMVYQ